MYVLVVLNNCKFKWFKVFFFVTTRALEEENSVLQAEYDRLKSQQPVGSPPDDGLTSQRSEADMLAEAKLLRQHKGRLEARMGILEEHNRQLEAQLHRLRQLLGEVLE